MVKEKTVGKVLRSNENVVIDKNAQSVMDRK